MSDFQTPPTYELPVQIDPQTGEARFSEVWLKWFLELIQTINAAGGTALQHNSLDGLQGGATGEFYHLTETQHTNLTDEGDTTLHFHSADRDRDNHTGTQLAATISDFNEAAQDAVGGILTDSASVNFTYDDAAGTITATIIIGGLDHGGLSGLADDDHTQYHNDTRALTWLGTRSTTDLAEGDNLYYTDERAEDAIGSILTDSAEIDFTYDDTTPSITATLKAGSIDETKLDASVNASLDLADSALQSGDNISELTNDAGYISSVSGDWTGTFDGQEGTYYLSRANHTGTQAASTISDFSEAAQDAVGAILTDSTEIDFTYNDATPSISAVIKDGSIAATKLDTAINASLDLADTAAQPGDNLSDFTNDAGFISSTSGDWTGTFDGQEGTYYLTRSNHTGTQAASTISDFNEAAQDAVGTILTDSTEIDFTYTDAGPTISASLKAGSIASTKLDTSVNASLGLADTAVQPGDNVSDLTNDAGYISSTTGDWSGTFDSHEGTYYLSRANHTGTQAVSTISGFDEAAQDAVGGILTDSTEIDFTYTDATPSITASIKTGSIASTKLDTAINASLDLADTAVQPGDNISDLTNDAGFISSTSGNWSGTFDSHEGTYYLSRANHTGTQAASTISDFSEAAQDAVGAILTDSTEIDFTYNDATPSITATLKLGSIDETKLDTSVNASLDLADTALQPGDNISSLTNDSGYISSTSGNWSGTFDSHEGAYYLSRANHTGTQTAATISDFNEAAQDVVGTLLTDSTEIDFTYTDATPSITAAIKSGSIAAGKLDASVNASLDLADSSLQSSDIGSTIQAFDANLSQLAALAVTDGNFIVGNGSAWVAESGSTARASLDVYSKAEVDAAVAAAGGQPTTKATQSSGTSLTTSAWTPVEWDGTAFDDDDWWAASPNPTRVTVDAAGRYQVTAQGRALVSAAGPVGCRLRLNGTTTIAISINNYRASAFGSTAFITTELELSANDYIELEIYHEEGSSVNTFPADCFLIVKLTLAS